jgi:hypothetical protein
MSPEEFTAKWGSEADAMDHRGALVNGAALLHEVLSDFDAVIRGHGEESLTLVEASRQSGYSADYLGSLVRQGRIPNAGRQSAPRIRRRDLPLKASRLPSSHTSFKLVGATPGQIVRAVVDSEKGAAR